VRRFLLVLCLFAVVGSGCAVGVRQPASNVTGNSATLNGKVLSTTGGAGSWFIEYGPTTARAERTPTTPIEFVTNQSEPVSEPVDGLDPDTTYHYAVCAEDSENPGDPFCSPDQTFTTDPTLDGEGLAATNLNTPFPSHVRYTSCHDEPDGSTVLEYEAAGPAGGPFPGTFVETGAIRSIGGEGFGEVTLSITATFSINDGEVTGTKTLAPTTRQFQSAACTGNTRGNGPFVFLDQPYDLDYTAEMHTPRGDFEDQGTATFFLMDTGTTTNIGNFEERFTSDQAAPAPTGQDASSSLSARAQHAADEPEPPVAERASQLEAISLDMARATPPRRAGTHRRG